MDKTTRAVLIVVSAILLFCACATVTVLVTSLWSFNRFANNLEQVVQVSPQEAVKLGYEIADFVVPPGFGSPYMAHFKDVTILVFTSQSERSHILLAEFPVGIDDDVEEMLRIIREIPGEPDNIWYDMDMTLVDQRPVTIRESVAKLNLYEGTSSQGRTYRMATAPFQGRGGPALVMVASPLAEWDQEMVDEFISSIQ